ncbi:MAG TPA: multicopper oxidase domain-containing protein [Candidatus Acidoferrales bacterium]|jgi:suppressor of ftsI|nr:multicopper oxidase domain-containing protein [Candidatus Acidoferrales bacterium]
MKRRYFLLAVGSATGTLLATDSCSSTASFISGTVPQPPNQAIALTARYAKTTIAGYTLHTRTYDGKTHGPIVETHPGQTLSFEIINELPANPPEKVPASALVPWYRNEMEAMGPARRRPHAYRLSTNIDKDNNPHGFNTTNLHVHGIQTVPHLFKPIGTSDPAAMMIEIEPGKRFRYDFPIPVDHPSGLFWYHPHKHGSSDVQISGGMAGLIVVRGAIDAVPEIAAAREIFMVVQTLDVNKSATDPHVYEREYKAYKTPAEGGYNDETDYTMMTVNGQGINWVNNDTGVNLPLGTPEFTMAPGEVVRLRLLNATGYYALALALPEFETWQIGFDGINLLEATKKDMSGTGVTLIDPNNVFDAPIQLASPANRIELLLKAPAKPGTYTLSSLATNGLSDRTKQPPKTALARFVVSGSPVTMQIPTSLPRPTREYPLIRDEEIVAKRTFAFQFAPSTRILDGFEFPINGELYEMSKCQTSVRAGTCEEWRIESADQVNAHPFHLHTNSFEVVAINDKPLDPVQIWDTFMLPQQTDGVNGSITIRIRFKQWRGKDVFHCHILTHEDTGMMQNFLIG